MDDVQEAAAVQAALEALPDDATAEQVMQVTRHYRASAVQTALMRMQEAAAGGGSLPDPEAGKFVKATDTEDGFEMSYPVGPYSGVAIGSYDTDFLEVTQLFDQYEVRLGNNIPQRGIAYGDARTHRLELRHQGDTRAELILSMDSTGEPTAALRIWNASGVQTAVELTQAFGLRLLGLPTANPNVADALWNENGFVRISAG